jgi:hypothetical protein
MRRRETAVAGVAAAGIAMAGIKSQETTQGVSNFFLK